MAKINLKNLTQTYCPICFSKLKIGTVSTIPQGMCITLNGKVYKRSIKKIEKSNEKWFDYYTSNCTAVKVGVNSLENVFPLQRLKLNNKMFQTRYMEKQSLMINYTFWECMNDDCYYYKCIDEVKSDYIEKNT